MTFYPEEPEPDTPRSLLPPRGWRPDPSETHLERYWEGTRWSDRTRDRVTKIENPLPGSHSLGAHGSGAYGSGSYGSGSYGSGSYGSGTYGSGTDSPEPYGGGPRDWSPSPGSYGGGPRDWSPPAPKRFRAWRMVGFSVLIVLGLAVVHQYIDQRGESSPMAGTLDFSVPAPVTDPQPGIPVDTPGVQVSPEDVDYPVFGSTELVTYLEAGMISHEPHLDVSRWALTDGTDAISEALLEAETQNPYLYVTGWEMMQRGSYFEVRPTYAYDAHEAERRRSATAQAVRTGLANAGVHSGLSDQEKATAIHDYIVNIAEYDEGAFYAIEDGEWSARVQQSQEAYGILVQGTAVCNGYAMAFSAMAHDAGLETVTVTGSDTAGATGGNHAWNKVLIDNRWLLVDATWNDPIGWNGEPLRDYLLLEDNDPILETRTIGYDWVVSENLVAYSSH